MKNLCKCTRSFWNLFTSFLGNENCNLAKSAEKTTTKQNRKKSYLYSKIDVVFIFAGECLTAQMLWLVYWKPCRCAYRCMRAHVNTWNFCEFIIVSVLSLGFAGFVKNNPHPEVACRAGFPSSFEETRRGRARTGYGERCKRKKSKPRTWEQGERVRVKKERNDGRAEGGMLNWGPARRWQQRVRYNKGVRVRSDRERCAKRQGERHSDSHGEISSAIGCEAQEVRNTHPERQADKKSWKK